MPPALVTATARSTGDPPAIGAMRIGTAASSDAANLRARSRVRSITIHYSEKLARHAASSPQNALVESRIMSVLTTG